jgi:hypothetical protein
MAEGTIGRILGREEEKPDVEATETMAGADTFAAAEVAHLAGTEIPPSSATIARCGSRLRTID